MAFDLPEPLVQVPAEQLGLRRVIHFDGPDSAAPPARSHFDFTGRPDIAHPLGGAARRHQIVEVVDGQHIDHHAAKPACFATAHAKSPGTGDADARSRPTSGSAYWRPWPRRGARRIAPTCCILSGGQLESTALVADDHDTPDTKKQEHCSLSCQNGQMAKRRDSRERIEAQIIELGRRHLVEHGAAGLSLRAIARDLGMVSSAVYRYVSSRDELLTLLLVDALFRARRRGGSRARRHVGRVERRRCRDRACGPRLGDRAPGQLGAAVRQPGARLPRTGRPNGRPRHAGGRRVVRRGGRRYRDRRHQADESACTTTDIVRLRTTPAGVRISRRRFRHRQMLRDLGGRGGRDQPRGVRAVRRSTRSATRRRCSTPRCGCWSACSTSPMSARSRSGSRRRIRTCSARTSAPQTPRGGNIISGGSCRGGRWVILRCDEPLIRITGPSRLGDERLECHGNGSHRAVRRQEVGAIARRPLRAGHLQLPRQPGRFRRPASR